MMIVDSKSIRNADSAREKGDDAGKTSRIKRHIGEGIIGLPHTMSVSTANMTDREGALLMIEACGDKLEEVLKVLADGVTQGRSLRRRSRNCLARKWKLPSVMNCTPSR
jgi:hypothetical protein